MQVLKSGVLSVRFSRSLKRDSRYSSLATALYSRMEHWISSIVSTISFKQSLSSHWPMPSNWFACGLYWWFEAAVPDFGSVHDQPGDKENVDDSNKDFFMSGDKRRDFFAASGFLRCISGCNPLNKHIRTDKSMIKLLWWYHLTKPIKSWFLSLGNPLSRYNEYTLPARYTMMQQTLDWVSNGTIRNKWN